MAKYKVGCYETVQAYIIVEAKSEKEALEKANEILENEGMPSDSKCIDREYEACSAEEIN